MFGLNNLFASGSQALSNISNNASIVINGLASGQAIPIQISQTVDPWQFAISTGVAVVSGVGILALPMLLGNDNPIKKASAVKAFNKLTNRPTLIIDHSKQSLFKPSMIDRKTVTDIINAMNRFGGHDFNLILNSGGGEVFSAQLISDAMTKYPGKIEVYVPKYAMSGATLLSFSGTNIHMSSYSSLGMLDAQIGGFMSSGSAKGWEEVVNFKGQKANDNSIIHARVGKQVTKSLQDNIFNLIKNKTPLAKQVVDFFTSGDREHIYQVKRDKMIELGFNNIYGITPQENKLLCQMVS